MGDTNMCTDNPILLNRTKNDRAIICAQRKAEKIIPTESDIIKANKLAFNDEIGTVTNYVTSMFEVQAGFEKGSEEYDELNYRIMCGQNAQQNVIDRCKGIIAKSMPEYWYSYRAIDKSDPRAGLNEKIVAAYKPYFMTYVYPSLKSKYSKYLRDNEESATDKFYSKYGVTSLRDLIEYEDKTNEMAEFLSHYESDRKIGLNPCIVNRICWHFEKAFPTTSFSRRKAPDFDWSILKSGVTYSKADYEQISRLYEQHKYELDAFMQKCRETGSSDGYGGYTKDDFAKRFRMFAFQICNNKYELCDIVIDLCYQSEGSKQFAWDVAGDIIIENLLNRNGHLIRYPSHGGNEFEYQGEMFSMKELCLLEDDYT